MCHHSRYEAAWQLSKMTDFVGKFYFLFSKLPSFACKICYLTILNYTANISCAFSYFLTGFIMRKIADECMASRRAIMLGVFNECVWGPEHIVLTFWNQSVDILGNFLYFWIHLVVSQPTRWKYGHTNIHIKQHRTHKVPMNAKTARFISKKGIWDMHETNILLSFFAKYIYVPIFFI